MLKTFGVQEYSSYIYLNFEEDPKLNDFFMGQLKPAQILENISLYINQDITSENTLLILDEIQESPSALNSLKYFQEQANQFHIVAAGSLLGIKLANTHGFPVGKVNLLDLYPMTFFEFLDAIEKNKLRNFLNQLKDPEPIPEPIHLELILLLKRYMYIGGMPEAVLEYVKTENLLSIRKIQKEILAAYSLDFSKHAPKEQLMKINHVWEGIPGQLAKENKKFIFSAIRKSARGRDYEEAIQWLFDANLIYKSYHITTPKLPLSGYTDKKYFKIFLLNVGLLAAMSKIPASLIIDDNKLFSEFKGAFTENFVAQELTAQFFSLHYWTSEGTAEVDFILEKDLRVFPLEVKSGTSLKKKSLLVYADKYKPDILFRTSLLNLKKDGKLFNIPLYMISAKFTH